MHSFSLTPSHSFFPPPAFSLFQQRQSKIMLAYLLIIARGKLHVNSKADIVVMNMQAAQQRRSHALYKQLMWTKGSILMFC